MQKNTKNQIIKTSIITGIIITTSFWLSACRNTDTGIENTGKEAGLVYINLIGTASETEVVKKSASENRSAVNNQIIKKIIPFDGITSIVATLTPETSVSPDRAISSLNPAAVKQSSTLENGIKYKVVVYNQNGIYAGENSYTTGDKNPVPFKLNGDQTYTFIAYSTGSKTTLPSVTNGGSGSTIANAKLSGITEDLMYMKKEMTVSGNTPNTLDIVLKHQFSQVNINMNAKQVGIFTQISNPLIVPLQTINKSADLNFATGSLTYSGSISGNIPVKFPGLTSTTNIVTSNPVQLISSGTTGELNIGSLALDGVAKQNVKFSDLKINPGLKYNLNIRFKPCRDYTKWVYIKLGNQNLNSGESELYSNTFTMPAADLGYEFNIYELDNSFNMKINGIQLATQEIQFEYSARTPNVRFADGTQYGNGYIPAIQTIKTVWPNAPLIKVTIDKNGNVAMFGKKSADGNLEPLYLYNGASFNKVTWYGDRNNEVIVFMEHLSTTNLISSSRGLKSIACTD